VLLALPRGRTATTLDDNLEGIPRLAPANFFKRKCSERAASHPVHILQLHIAHY